MTCPSQPSVPTSPPCSPIWACESPQTGALREVSEETGYEARITGAPLILSDTGEWPVADPPIPYHQVRFVYPMEIVGGEERVEVDGSTDALGWFSVRELAGIAIVPLVSLAPGLPLADVSTPSAEAGAAP